MKLYVLLRDDMYTDSHNEFVACRKTFDEARSLMELLADQFLDTVYEDACDINEDWDYIEIDGTRFFCGYEKLFIEEIEV